ncbi:GNAT family N-acetyltransferase [Exiguobacterium sp. RIT594]|uniref:GNAT family N-acetyltransferase n=1 Tax=Exiguobacterium sp. RIT594 TaxID=2282449 RepID=UPI000DF72BA5|nr:GNAT family N-acetyltransferase [Exiguobacterium sp. RIT594]RDB34898.1 GNAT family N-acetyltransferase [Exiguobacterium sp. RIT594]
MPLRFVPVTKKDFPTIQSIYAENPHYVQLEGRLLPLSEHELEAEFLNPDTISLLCLDGEDILALIDYLPEHPTDHSTWIGLFLIPGRLHRQGIGSMIYRIFHEHHLQDCPVIRLAVLPANISGHRFWEHLGFRFERYGKSNHNQPVEVFIKMKSSDDHMLK